MTTELDLYPATGRFLMGRMRHLMSNQEKGLLEEAVDAVETVDHGHRIHLRQADINHFTILIEGLAIRSIVENDKRCIIGVHIPGDFMDIHALAMNRLDHDLVTIGPAKIGYVAHSNVYDLLQAEGQLSRLIWLSTLLDAAIQRQWTLKLSKLKASPCLANLLAELWARLEQVDLANDNGFKTSLTQADLADMCGTTPIHMNRAVRDLRTRGLAEIRRGNVTSKKRSELEKFGEFDPSFLQCEASLMGDYLKLDASNLQTRLA